MRPRYSGYIAFQMAGSALLREGLIQAMDRRHLLARLQELYEKSWARRV